METIQAVGDWVEKTTGKISAPQARRAKLLAWLLLVILALLGSAFVLVLLVDPTNSPSRAEYTMLIAGMAGIVGLAFGLNRTGKLIIAAWLTVALAFLAPWIALVLDSSILQGDFFPLCFVLVAVLLSSVLLSPSITIFIAVLQFTGITLVLILNPATALINWPSMVSLLFFISVLSILINFLTRSDIRKLNTRPISLN